MGRPSRLAGIAFPVAVQVIADLAVCIMQPHEIVRGALLGLKAGDIVTVRVVEVDRDLRRIALTMKLDAPAAAARPACCRSSKTARIPAKTCPLTPSAKTRRMRPQ